MRRRRLCATAPLPGTKRELGTDPLRAAAAPGGRYPAAITCPPPPGEGGGWRRASGAAGINRRPAGTQAGRGRAGLGGQGECGAKLRSRLQRGAGGLGAEAAAPGEMEGKRRGAAAALSPPPLSFRFGGAAGASRARCALPASAGGLQGARASGLRARLPRGQELPRGVWGRAASLPACCVSPSKLPLLRCCRDASKCFRKV